MRTNNIASRVCIAHKQKNKLSYFSMRKRGQTGDSNQKMQYVDRNTIFFTPIVA